ncbi:hypothetical protein SCHAM137S_02257 [Streptomyces chartreusis]
MFLAVAASIIAGSAAVDAPGPITIAQVPSVSTGSGQPAKRASSALWSESAPSALPHSEARSLSSAWPTLARSPPDSTHEPHSPLPHSQPDVPSERASHERQNCLARALHRPGTRPPSPSLIEAAGQGRTSGKRPAPRHAPTETCPRDRPESLGIRKTAGQSLFAAGSRIATHSTCEVYPNGPQRSALARAFGCARVVYNDALRARETARVAGLPFVTSAELSKQVTVAKQTEERAWLAEVSAVVLQPSLRDLDTAYRNFFDGLKGKRPRTVHPGSSRARTTSTASVSPRTPGGRSRLEATCRCRRSATSG